MRRDSCSEVLRHDQLIERATARFVRGVAEQAGKLAVDAHYALLQVEHDDGFGRALEQLVEERRLHAQPLLGPLPSAKLANGQPDQQHHRQAQQPRAHGAVQGLCPPCVECHRLVDPDPHRHRKARHRLHCIDFTATVDRVLHGGGNRLTP